jgi:ATP-dependent Clp protease adaptor protein ClpS
MDFVIAVLMQIFGKSSREATKIMLDVHEKGSGVAGVYIKDIAQTKSTLTNKVAYEKGFPLKTKVQQE